MPATLGLTFSFMRPPAAQQATSGSAKPSRALLTIRQLRSAGRLAPALNTSSMTRSALRSSSLCESPHDWLSGRHTLCGADSTVASNGSVSFTENLIRVGVNYKFSW